MKEIRLKAIGGIAREVLDKSEEAHLMGATSRGFFLSLPSSWVVFLSTEAYRGPLTLNLAGQGADFRRLKAGQPVEIFPDRISLPQSGLVIHTGQAQPWKAPPPPSKILPPSERITLMTQVARLALAAGQPSQFSALLPVFLGFVKGTEIQGNDVFPKLERLRKSLQQQKTSAIVENLQALLGLGSGLTPGGDDIVTGFLLALKRWGHILAPGLEVETIAQGILPLAYRKTTTLSANLIECAAQGQANERLLLALDGIMTGTPHAITCASYLAEWGNTSGLDALVGMALAGLS